MVLVLVGLINISATYFYNNGYIDVSGGSGGIGGNGGGGYPNGDKGADGTYGSNGTFAVLIATLKTPANASLGPRTVNLTFIVNSSTNNTFPVSVVVNESVRCNFPSYQNGTLQNCTLVLSEDDYKWYVNASTVYVRTKSETWQFTIWKEPLWTYNSTNNTKPGKPTEFRLKWEDTYGLSGFILSIDNCTGNFQDQAWKPMTGTTNWTNYSSTSAVYVINDTQGCPIRWKSSANNTKNVGSVSDVFSFTALYPLIIQNQQSFINLDDRYGYNITATVSDERGLSYTSNCSLIHSHGSYLSSSTPCYLGYNCKLGNYNPSNGNCTTNISTSDQNQISWMNKINSNTNQHAIIVNETEGFVYLVDNNSVVYKINATNGTIIKSVDVSNFNYARGLSQDDNFLYFVSYNMTNTTLIQVKKSDLSVEKSELVGDDVYEGYSTTNDADFVYVGYRKSIMGFVQKINKTNFSDVKWTTLVNYFRGMDNNKNGNGVYVCTGNYIRKMNKTDGVTDWSKGFTCFAVTFDPYAGNIWAGDNSYNLTLFDESTGSIIRSYDYGSGTINDIAVDANYVYIFDSVGNVTKINKTNLNDVKWSFYLPSKSFYGGDIDTKYVYTYDNSTNGNIFKLYKSDANYTINERVYSKIRFTDLYGIYNETNVDSNLIKGPSLSVNLNTPSPNFITNIYQNKLFNVNATVTCRDALCGNVFGTVRYNASVNPDTDINTSVGATPFYIIGGINGTYIGPTEARNSTSNVLIEVNTSNNVYAIEKCSNCPYTNFIYINFTTSVTYRDVTIEWKTSARAENAILYCWEGGGFESAIANTFSGTDVNTTASLETCVKKEGKYMFKINSVADIANGDAELYVDYIFINNSVAASNPFSCGPLSKNQSCEFNWIVNATGPIDSAYKVGVLFNLSYPLEVQNHTNNATVQITGGNLEVNLTYPPITTTNVNQNTIFNVNATVACRNAACGNVFGTIRYNASSANPDTDISTTKENTPFYITFSKKTMLPTEARNSTLDETARVNRSDDSRGHESCSGTMGCDSPYLKTNFTTSVTYDNVTVEGYYIYNPFLGSSDFDCYNGTSWINLGSIPYPTEANTTFNLTLCSNSNGNYIFRAKCHSESDLVETVSCDIYIDYIFMNITTNPISCGSLNQDQSYQLNWTVNATGDSVYKIGVLFNSLYNTVSKNHTKNATVRIITPSYTYLYLNWSQRDKSYNKSEIAYIYANCTGCKDGTSISLYANYTSSSLSELSPHDHHSDPNNDVYNSTNTANLALGSYLIKANTSDELHSPSQVNYTLTVVDKIPPKYSDNSTNSTIAGRPTLFSLNWTDNVGLSGYIFSFNNGTTNSSGQILSNSTWKAYYGTPASDNPDLATTEFSATDYNSTNVSDNNEMMTYGNQWAFQKFEYNFSKLPSFNRGTVTFLQYCFQGYYTYDFYEISCDAETKYYNWTSSSWTTDQNINLSSDTTLCKNFTSGFSSIINSSNFFKWTARAYSAALGGPYIYTNFVNLTVTYQALVNNTWVSFTTTWSNVTKTVNSTVGANISWMIYANDSSNNWNQTDIYSFQTISPYSQIWNLAVRDAFTGTPISNTPTGQRVIISVNVSGSINYVQGNFTWPNGTSVLKNLTLNETANYNFNWTYFIPYDVPYSPPNASINVTVYDINGYSNSTNTTLQIKQTYDISLINNVINFSTSYVGQEVNAIDNYGWPLWIIVRGNIPVNLSQAGGAYLVGNSNPNSKIGIGNVSWNITSDANTFTKLTTDYVNIESNIRIKDEPV
ncbi:MAG: hypothetical protein NTW30_03920, partial [Candidatus Aenigmarchaeota archaeon]|nr:hypothetical protein [Candidatus Aenigmarchaeota archaeon]